MHIYRYRSAGLLTIKELMYDELYFASQAELNDPVDMLANFTFFSGERDLWQKTILKLTGHERVSELAAMYLDSICPISYQELLSSYEKYGQAMITSIAAHIGAGTQLSTVLVALYNNFQKLLEFYRPNTGYSVSFAKANDEMLMWSHYTGSHRGCCFIFRPVDNAIHQCHMRARDSIRVTSHFTCGMPTELKLKSINYAPEVDPMSGFTLFPSAYTGLKFESEELRLKFHADKEKQLLIKNPCWEYEEEVRLLLHQPSRWVDGESEFSPYQRVFHYDSSQLVGVIFGANMSSADKANIKEILDMKLESRRVSERKGKQYIFDFLYQQASICPSSRKVQINNVELVSWGGNRYTPDKPKFNEHYIKWLLGSGVTYEEGKMSYGSIK